MVVCSPVYVVIVAKIGEDSMKKNDEKLTFLEWTGAVLLWCGVCLGFGKLTNYMIGDGLAIIGTIVIGVKWLRSLKF